MTGQLSAAQDRLVEALRAIIAIPSERTLLLNAEARAMYEIAKRALEEVDRVRANACEDIDVEPVTPRSDFGI